LLRFYTFWKWQHLLIMEYMIPLRVDIIYLSAYRIRSVFQSNACKHAINSPSLWVTLSYFRELTCLCCMSSAKDNTCKSTILRLWIIQGLFFVALFIPSFFIHFTLCKSKLWPSFSSYYI
jgi:hypothetical protein